MLKVYDEGRRRKLVREVTDYLFDKGYKITKSLVEDIALLIYDKEDRVRYDATTTVTTTQPKSMEAEALLQHQRDHANLFGKSNYDPKNIPQ